MPLSWTDLGTTVGINVAISVGVFFGFNYLRSQKLLSDFYGAKRKLSLPFRCDQLLRLLLLRPGLPPPVAVPGLAASSSLPTPGVTPARLPLAECDDMLVLFVLIESACATAWGCEDRPPPV